MVFTSVDIQCHSHLPCAITFDVQPVEYRELPAQGMHDADWFCLPSRALWTVGFVRTRSDQPEQPASSEEWFRSFAQRRGGITRQQRLREVVCAFGI